tara:strand:+ start:1192 stop:2361 length:1170 start_codon:yes stop_codon:yes gene_type:complete
MDKITFVLPSRNNLEFLKLAYKSLKNLSKDHEILILNDASFDGTKEWLDSLEDNNLIVYTNPGPERIGIVGMFDKGIEMATTDIIFAFHADMVAGSSLDTNILKHLEPGVVVCATRVEPPIHPPGPEKIIENFGVEPEEFDFDKWYSAELEILDKTTNGIFAPWCMYKEDYLAVGGHDELFAPQSREDSDLFNRFVLKEYKLIQSWDGIVYHFTSRGSRFNKHSGGGVGKDSSEWQQTNSKNIRNFVRKWGTLVQHDHFMKPVVSPKYDIALVIHNCTSELLYILEPYCSTICVAGPSMIKNYINVEQPNTLYKLNEKILGMHKKYGIIPKNDIVVEFDARQLTDENTMFISQLPYILHDSGEVGKMQYSIFTLDIRSLNTYEMDFVPR